MKLISHRGNISGIEIDKENDPDQVQICIDRGYDVEIDLRMKGKMPHLGHDYPQHAIDSSWILERKDNLWIHVKEYAALVWLKENVPESRYFCHKSDDFTLVSNGKIWLHDLKNEMNDECVIPLLSINDVQNFNFSMSNLPGAICTDYVAEVQRILYSLQSH